MFQFSFFPVSRGTIEIPQNECCTSSALKMTKMVQEQCEPNATQSLWTLAPNEKVYVTQITVKRDAAMFELLTVDVATIGWTGNPLQGRTQDQAPRLGHHDAREYEEGH